MKLSKLLPFLKKNDKVKVFDMELAFESLKEAVTLLNGINVKAWLTDGTHLGFYREGYFIKHDNDIDLGCKIDNYSKSIDTAFEACGWNLKRTCGSLDCGFEQTWQKNGVRIDIFYFYTEQDRMWHGAWLRDKQTKKRNLIKYNYPAFELKTITYHGYDFNVPFDQEDYVTRKYGPEWRTPVKEWDWAFGPQNAEKTDIWI